MHLLTLWAFEDGCASSTVGLLGNVGGTNRLEGLLVDRFYRLYQAHAPEHRDELVFSYHLGYPFLNYAFPADDGPFCEAF